MVRARGSHHVGVMQVFPIHRAMIGAALLAVSVSGCTASAPEPSWSKLLSVENRFAVYLHHPGEPNSGDVARVRLIYVYGTGEVEWEGEEVAWQEYTEMTIDCATNYASLGPRFRYAPDGAQGFADEKREANLIAPGTRTAIAAAAKCEGEFPADTHSIADEPGWMNEARQRLAGYVETRSL